MSINPQKLGEENRSSVLPTAFPSQELMGPSYNFADELPTPAQVGVRRSNSLTSVLNAAQGAMYYVDMIGFGAPSSPFTRNLGARPLGINYFVQTMSKCSNGANMSIYVNGIPKGDALGRQVQKALDEMRLPALKGLAPGMIEDVKSALDPRGVTNAIFGSGYMQCKQATLPIGDSAGSLKGKDGIPWIQPAFPGDIQYFNGRPHQTRWVFDKWLTQEEFQKLYEQRLFCPDGSRIASHQDGDCSKPLTGREGFLNGTTSSVSEQLLPVALLLAVGTVLYVRYRNG